MAVSPPEGGPPARGALPEIIVDGEKEDDSVILKIANFWIVVAQSPQTSGLLVNDEGGNLVSVHVS